VAERFFGRLQGERTALRHSATRHDAQDDGVEAIEMFYNSTPLHSSLGSVRPNDYEELAKVASLSVRFCLTTTRCWGAGSVKPSGKPTGAVAATVP
jgi:hypothetical protein